MMALVTKMLYTSLGVSVQAALGRAWHPCSFQLQEDIMWLWLYQTTLSTVHNDCHVDKLLVHDHLFFKKFNFCVLKYLICAHIEIKRVII